GLMWAALFPEVASLEAADVDRIYFVLLAASAAIILLVLVLVVTFSIRFRRGSRADRGELPAVFSREIEIGWTTATLFAFLFFFWWTASTQLSARSAPKGALEIHVV